eukprot:s213_g7.t1
MPESRDIICAALLEQSFTTWLIGYCISAMRAVTQESAPAGLCTMYTSYDSMDACGHFLASATGIIKLQIQHGTITRAVDPKRCRCQLLTWPRCSKQQGGEFRDPSRRPHSKAQEASTERMVKGETKAADVPEVKRTSREELVDELSQRVHQTIQKAGANAPSL